SPFSTVKGRRGTRPYRPDSRRFDRLASSSTVAVRIGASFVSLKSSNKSWKTRRCPRVFEVYSRYNEALMGKH
ncbi:Hypothetical predicted protein, partial [Olea europaea subsp. europaea]